MKAIKVARILLPVTIAAAGSGCELSSQDQAALNGAFDVQAPSPVPGPSVKPECFNERFVQAEPIVNRKVDLLFVADTSGSIVDERGAVADGIDAFVAALPANTDFRIAVLLAHGSRSSWAGKLYKKGSEPVVLRSDQLSSSDIRTHLRAKLANPASDYYGDGGEEGLWAIARSLDSDRLTQSKADGFFREDAALAVVTISDENDICSSFPAGYTPVYDGDGLEAPARARDCVRTVNGVSETISPSLILSKLRALQSSRPLLVSGIHYTDPVNFPRGGENEYGYGFMDLIQLGGGLAIEMSTGHYDSGLAQIGSLAVVQQRILNEFVLARPEIDSSTIEASVDGSGVSFEYRAQNNSVYLPNAGQGLSTVDINYCLKPVVIEDPCANNACIPDTGV